MGTLTANSIRLPEYCEHKLPTSCRLSSIPNCCACADERAHSAAYSTYIDGVGFVARGNRWQRYCWFCKEFWEQRIRVSGLRPAQTRIPQVPDQTEFVEKWYEFHRGYRVVRREDGSEERVEILGEDFKEVSPGFLPRTLEELRSGRREEVAQNVHQAARQEQQDNGPGLEDTLEQMFVAASSEDSGEQQRSAVPSVASSQVSRMIQQNPRRTLQRRTRSNNLNIHAQAMNPPPTRNREYQIRRVTALRRELNRMRNGIERVISGLRDLGEEVPNHDETTGRLTALGQTLDSISDAPSGEDSHHSVNNMDTPPTSSDAPSMSQTDRTLANIQIRVDEARTQMEEASRARDQAASEFDLAEQEFRSSQQQFQQLQREQRSTENYIRIFGTREEMLAQGENYESPIGGMFRRANERFRAAEEVRREERTLRQVLEDEARTGGEEEARRLAELEASERDVWGVPQADARNTTSSREWLPDAQTGAAMARAVVEQDYGRIVVSPSRTENNQPTDVVGSDTPPLFTPTGQESMLQDYYAMLRQEDRNRHAPPTALGIEEPPEGAATDDGGAARSMLDAIVTARERELVERSNLLPQGPVPEEPLANQLFVQHGSVNLAPVDEPVDEPVTPILFSQDAWWHQDANHILQALTTNETLRDELHMRLQEASAMLTYFIEDRVDERDRTIIDELLRNPTVIWRTGLPAEWLQRRRDQQQGVTLNIPNIFFVGLEDFAGWRDWAAHYNPLMKTEIVAQAFQMSSDIRRLAPNVDPAERSPMFDRLQAGQRTDGDIAVLEAMRDDFPTWSLALDRYQRTLYPQTYDRNRPTDRYGIQHDEEEAQRRLTDATRRDMAQNGDHSRHELDIRRRETGQAFALAAGRQAMQTGSQALLERMADRDEGTRAAYHRLQANMLSDRSRNPTRARPTLYRQLTLSDYLNHGSDSDNTDDSDDSDKEEDSEANARGLDARETGRPEPKEESELQVQMECKICFTQLSEVACLPCGHLVMCRWCSEQHSPCLQQDPTRPMRAAACPVCRKGIRQKVRVFRA